MEYAGAFRRAHSLRDGHAARVIHVEPRYSMTAANADEWVASQPGAEAAIALALLRLVLEAKQVPALPAKEAEALTAAARTVEVEAVAKQSGVPAAKLKHLAETLVKGAPSLVVGGGVATSGVGAAGRGGRREPPELRPRERGPHRALRAELGALRRRAATRTSSP